jgi:hypothetical protein
MPDWWTYSLSDFLLFSPRTYYRLLQRHNESMWPGQLVTMGLGFLILALLRHPSPRQSRVICIALALLWALVAWAFLWNRYASINWAVTYVVPGFLVEVLLFLGLAARGVGPSFRMARSAAGIAGATLFILALVLYPALAPLAGRHWGQAEIFGITPDPTVIGTLGLLLLAEGRSTWMLLIVPIAWCLMSGATLWALGSPEAWLLLLLPPLSVMALAGSRANRTRVTNEVRIPPSWM